MRFLNKLMQIKIIPSRWKEQSPIHWSSWPSFVHFHYIFAKWENCTCQLPTGQTNSRNDQSPDSSRFPPLPLLSCYVVLEGRWKVFRFFLPIFKPIPGSYMILTRFLGFVFKWYVCMEFMSEDPRIFFS